MTVKHTYGLKPLRLKEVCYRSIKPVKDKWKSSGGDVKIFKTEGEGDYIIKWHGPRSRKLVIQSDNAE